MALLYADVILPLPLYASFTYVVPEDLKNSLKVGCRVLVQFGKSKIYTGIVESIHSNKPTQFEPKEILSQLDVSPVLRHPQLKLWKWMADYYLCSQGDIMKAALPAALKIESETWVEVYADAEPDEIATLSERQASIYAYISHERKARVAQIERALSLSGTRAVINRLIEKGLIRISERLADKYITKRVTLVTLNCERTDTAKIHDFFALTTRSERQEKLLVAYLDLSGWLNTDKSVKPVERNALLARSGVTPSVLKGLIDKGILCLYKQEINRFMPPTEDTIMPLPVLSDAQSEAIRSLRRAMGAHLVSLLHGVTGSGKTEIYSHLIHDSLNHGDQVLFLVPEISLTTQLTTRLQRIFGTKLTVYHSKFSDNERVDIWKKLLGSSEPRLILGVRSSIFLPFSRLGLVIIDEEHDTSYKQYDPAPRYNARDTAIMLASMHGAKVVLGSATPSIETYYKARQGKYGLVELKKRYGDVLLPHVNVVDMAEQRKRKNNRGLFSAPLLNAIDAATCNNAQAIIFQNRRGYAPMVICAMCGWTPKCHNCDVSLVYHKRINELRCHYCGYTMTLPKVCPACGENSLQTFGYGTERIAENLHDIFPSLRISRMDLDTTRNKESHGKIIDDFSNHHSDLLVGTQMVSKGLDFKNVKLVGILNADTMLNFPDFRSDERAFNMMEQVAGRAGRHDGKGEVIIQTTNYVNEVIADVVAHDYEHYYNREISQREKYAYPPFTKIINIYLRHRDERVLIGLTVNYTKELRRVFGSRVLGPETPYVSKISNFHIRTIMLKIEAGASMSKVKELLRAIYLNLASLPATKQLQLHYDVDPV